MYVMYLHTTKKEKKAPYNLTFQLFNAPYSPIITKVNVAIIFKFIV